MSLDLSIAFPEVFTIVIYSERELSYNDLFSDVVKTYILYLLFVLLHLVRYCAISIVILSAPPAGNLLCTNAIFVIYLCYLFFFLERSTVVERLFYTCRIFVLYV